jgi:hypothetical protein
MRSMKTDVAGGQVVAPADKRISGSPSFDPTDTVLRDIRSPIKDIFCSPKSGGSGVSDRVADAPKAKLP